jgi:hypothetical protein
MKRIWIVCGLAVAASSVSYGFLAAFDAAEQRHRASVDATFEKVGPLAPAATEPQGSTLPADDALAWENVRHLRVRQSNDGGTPD